MFQRLNCSHPIGIIQPWKVVTLMSAAVEPSSSMQPITWLPFGMFHLTLGYYYAQDGGSDVPHGAYIMLFGMQAVTTIGPNPGYALLVLERRIGAVYDTGMYSQGAKS